MDAMATAGTPKQETPAKAGIFRAKPALLLAAIALQAAFLYGCAGIVAQDSQNPPPTEAQLTVTPASVSFGSVSDGTTNTQTVQLKNSGNANLTISQWTMSGTGFSQTGLSAPMTLAAGDATSFTVKFAPAKAGSASGTMTLVSNAVESSTAIPMSGTGTAAALTLAVSPTSLSFGNVNEGSSSAVQDFKITNTGNSSVAISSIKSSGTGFAITSGGSAVTLTPSQSVTVGVQFTASAAGNATGSVSVTSNATGSPSKVNLSGTGVAPPPAGSHTASLRWTPSTSTVSGYNVYRSTVSGGSYTKLNSSPVGGSNYTDSTVQNGKTYFYVTTAVDSSGDESSYSNETQAVIP
jgi:centrosomal CEP192-like protein/HYDIN/CFA65/VesB family protein